MMLMFLKIYVWGGGKIQGLMTSAGILVEGEGESDDGRRWWEAIPDLSGRDLIFLLFPLIYNSSFEVKS